MTTASDDQPIDHAELASLYALKALPGAELRAAEAHIGQCAQCQQELVALGPIVDGLGREAFDVLRPKASLWPRLAERVGVPAAPEQATPAGPDWQEPEWKEAAPGISVKLLATDPDRNEVSMLVRLAPDTHYPPHAHAGVEELHLLDGELWIEDRLLFPGDYNRAEPGTADKRVYSETGCTCVLITSTRDRIG
jgi:hypothetical protein